jgi:hypothetical protein
MWTGLSAKASGPPAVALVLGLLAGFYLKYRNFSNVNPRFNRRENP